MDATDTARTFGSDAGTTPGRPADFPEVEERPVPDRAAPSLMADVEALVADGKTYLEAELRFQKGRAGFTANRLQKAAVHGMAALALLHLALIALTVGLVIALTPLIGAWIATAIVVALLLLGALLFGLRLRAKLREISAVFEDTAS